MVDNANRKLASKISVLMDFMNSNDGGQKRSI